MTTNRDTATSAFDTDELVINMGPQHPSTHGVLRLVLRLDGERVIDMDVVIGYLHRGVEKLTEQRDYTQIVLLTDRMDYVAAASNNLGYVETVEKLMSLEVPKRAQYIRTVLAELQRIASHLVWLGTHAMDIGAVTVFLYCLRERELVLDLFEEYCGARLTYNAMRVGGLPMDLSTGWEAKVRAFCDLLPGKIDDYETLLTNNRIWLERTKDVGVISGADATAIGLTGPALRASGVRRDVRKDEPYAAYDGLRLRGRRSARAGDTYDRYTRAPRLRSASPCGSSSQALDGLPDGPVMGKVPRLIKPPAGETYHAIEAPKGELGLLHRERRPVAVSPYRLRVQAAVALQPPGAAACSRAGTSSPTWSP
jgi:NADH-quinone oxidoreductase subunit D